MTKKSIRRWFIGAIAVFTILAIVGILISIFDCTEERIVFSTFKDLLPIFIGITAVWLGYCAQRRHAYQQQLRSLWSSLVEAAHCALQYCQFEITTEAQYRTVLIKLSVAIDEVRGVFCNLPDANIKSGLYPFEPIKNIYLLVEDLGFGPSIQRCEAQTCHKKVFALWKDVRDEILKEFDREVPTFPHSHWVDLSKARVYDEHKIPKQAT
ncbi:MAG: hypothetical protein PHT49_00545 [Desulfovibrionales bacterium]|nr:hypothetical protein [Desulfovibrionales bacterium]